MAAYPSGSCEATLLLLQTSDLLDCCCPRQATGTQIALRTEFFNSIEGLWCVARRLSSIDVNGDLQSYPSHAIHLRLVIVESHHFYKKIDRLEKSRPRNTIQNLNGDTAPDCSA